MSQHWKSPSVNGNREGGMSPFLTPSQRNISPKNWSSPHQSWKRRNWSAPQSNWSAPQSNWSPQHYNSYSSQDRYWGSQRQWSPNQWEPSSNYHRNWGSTPRTPKYFGPVYPERKTQVHFRRNHKDISHYYSPSMVEDPWAELEPKVTRSAVST